MPHQALHVKELGCKLHPDSLDSAKQQQRKHPASDHPGIRLYNARNLVCPHKQTTSHINQQISPHNQKQKTSKQSKTINTARAGAGFYKIDSRNSERILSNLPGVVDVAWAPTSGLQHLQTMKWPGKSIDESVYTIA